MYLPVWYWMSVINRYQTPLFTAQRSPHERRSSISRSILLQIVNRYLSNNVPVSRSGIFTSMCPKARGIPLLRVLPTTTSLLPSHSLLPRHLSIKRIGCNQTECRSRIHPFNSFVSPNCPACIIGVGEIKMLESPFLGKVHPVNHIGQSHAIAPVYCALDEDGQLWICKTHLTLHSTQIVRQMSGLGGYDAEEDVSDTKAPEKRIGVKELARRGGWTRDLLANARECFAFQERNSFLEFLCRNANIPALKRMVNLIAFYQAEDSVRAYISHPACSIVHQSRYSYHARSNTSLFKCLHDFSNLQSPVSMAACMWLCRFFTVVFRSLTC